MRGGGHPALDEIAPMADTLAHRGPDGRSCYRSPTGRCALGHTRLKVIDLETGDQPMPNEDGSVQVVFNGEIYNHRELRRELEGLGHHFVPRVTRRFWPTDTRSGATTSRAGSRACLRSLFGARQPVSYF